jgi:hypothetical protein
MTKKIHDCHYLLPDDYPCREVGVVKVGRHWYCADHAAEVASTDADEWYFGGDMD